MNNWLTLGLLFFIFNRRLPLETLDSTRLDSIAPFGLPSVRASGGHQLASRRARYPRRSPGARSNRKRTRRCIYRGILASILPVRLRAFKHGKFNTRRRTPRKLGAMNFSRESPRNERISFAVESGGTQPLTGRHRGEIFPRQWFPGDANHLVIRFLSVSWSFRVGRLRSLLSVYLCRWHGFLLHRRDSRGRDFGITARSRNGPFTASRETDSFVAIHSPWHVLRIGATSREFSMHPVQSFQLTVARSPLSGKCSRFMHR